MKKKKSTVSPEAAKILEQYRNAGKAPSGNPGVEGGEASHPDKGPTQRPNAPVPSHNPTRQRSGTRGK